MEPVPGDRDREDVRRVLAGDLEAFEGIVERWQRPLVSLAYRFCRHQGQAEEMAQEAFLRAFRFLDQWRQDAAFSTWLYALALNVFRSAVRRHAVSELPADAAREPVAPAGAANDLEARSTKEAVRRTVATLPRRYREVVILFYFLEQNVEESARCLGIPDGTFKARLHRARGLLRDRLTRVLGDRRGTT